MGSGREYHLVIPVLKSTGCIKTQGSCETLQLGSEHGLHDDESSHSSDKPSLSPVI